MRLAKVGGATFLSAKDIVDLLRAIDNGTYTNLADVIEQMVFSAELHLDLNTPLDVESNDEYSEPADVEE